MSALAMTSVQLPDKVALKLGARGPYSRDLVIELSRHQQRLDAWVFQPTGHLVSYVGSALESCALRVTAGNSPGLIFCSGSTYSMIQLLPGEPEAIEAQFAPHGLKVERS